MGAGFFIVGWFLWWPFSFFSGWGVGLLFRFVIIIGRLSSNVVYHPIYFVIVFVVVLIIFLVMITVAS